MTTSPKPPLWALILGTLGICAGAFGMLAGAQDIAMPWLVTIQKQAATRISTALEEPGAGSSHSATPPKSAWTRIKHSMLSSPPWYPRYALAMGVTRLVLGAACLLASLALIQVRPGADFHFMLALGLSAARNLTAAGMGIAAGTLFSYWAVASGILGFTLDGILVVSCAISNRSAYQPL